MNLLDYFLKANLYGLLFVSCYWLLLRRHTFFGLNRAYLLASALLSLVLPFVSLPTHTLATLPEQMPVGVITLPVAVVATSPVAATPDWENVTLIAYSTIGLVFLLLLTLRIGRLLRLIRQSPRQRIADYVLVQPHDKKVPTFSFFHYLVLNPSDVSVQSVIDHELVHIRQQHSIDVVSMSLLRAVFWGCPALWLLDKMLRQVHEFLADRAASGRAASGRVTSGQASVGSAVTSPTDYARFLVDYAFCAHTDTLANSFFNPSLLKQRIMMLCTKPTTRWALGKYAIILPLAFGLLAMTTARDEITAMISQTTDERITVSGTVTNKADGKPIPGVSIVVKNRKLGTSTDVGGKYKLSNVATNESLVFSFVGFKTQVIPVNGRKTINVSLMAGSDGLKEVPLVGFGYEPSSGTKSSQNEEVFRFVEQQPEFPGGIPALGRYLAKNLRYPKEAQQNRIQGKVFVQFVISSTGTVHDLRVLKGIGGGCDEEAVRVVSQMPAWKPGRQQGKAVNVVYNLPINFALEQAPDKRTGQLTPKTDSSQQLDVANLKNSRTGLYTDPKEPVFYSGDEIRQKYPEAVREQDSLRLKYPKTNVSINGFSNSLGKQPLTFIDGVEVPGETLKNLEPNTIESVTVLKDAVSKAQYGEKAKDGVILITTKKK